MRSTLTTAAVIGLSLAAASSALADHVNVTVDGVAAKDGSITFPSVKIDKGRIRRRARG